MPRYRTNRDRDDVGQITGDNQFIGVNMRLDPNVVPAGYVSEAINCRFTRGIIETRKGITFPVWANKSTSTGVATGSVLTTQSGGFHIVVVNLLATVNQTASPHGLAEGQKFVLNRTFSPQFDGTYTVRTVISSTSFTFDVTNPPWSNNMNINQEYRITPVGPLPWNVIYGAGTFNDPATLREYVIIASDQGVYYTSPNNAPIQIPLPSGVTIAAAVTFTQAFDILLLHRGESLSTLKMQNVQDGFSEIVQGSTTTSGTTAIPQSNRSLFFQNRLFVPFANDQIAISDFNDYTNYLPVLQEFRINQGSADSLVTIAKFNDTTIVALKGSSVYSVNNVYGNLAATQLDQITDKFGCIAAKSVAHVGNQLWFLSDLGVIAIAQTATNVLQASDVPVSDPIQPLIDRINWKYAANAVSAYWDNKYYLAVPLDDAEVLGRELIYYQSRFFGDAVFVGLIVGATYRWNKGQTGTSLVCGATTLTSSGDFVALSSTVTLAGTLATVIDGSLKRVITGINNAVLVYDLVNQAWSGYDTSDGLMVQDFFQYHVGGKLRLLFSSNDGYVKMYEDGYDEQLSEPYLQVNVSSVPSVGNTVSVNGGTTATATALDNPVGATDWAIGATPDVQTSRTYFMYQDFVNTYNSFSPFNPRWTSPNTIGYGTNRIAASSGPSPSASQFYYRFYGSNGVLPIISYTGSWATVTSFAVASITTSITTRAYASDQDVEQYKYVSTDLQTWNPSYSISIISAGELEEFQKVTNRTRSQTEWYKPFDKTAFDPTNADGRFMDKYRKDYSLLLGPTTSGGQAASARIDTTSGGLRLDLHQEARETIRVLNQSPGLQVKIVNTSGRIRVVDMIIEGTKKEVTATVQA